MGLKNHNIKSRKYKVRFKILEDNGWTDLHHVDNWVPVRYFKSKTIDVDRAGCSMEGAWLSLPEEERKREETEVIEEDLSFIQKILKRLW